MNKYLYIIVIIAAGLLIWVLVTVLNKSDMVVKHSPEPDSSSQQAVPEEPMDEKARGEKLFNQNCTSCHALDEKVVGPPLRNITAKHEEKWLIDFIRDSQKMISLGDKEAVKIYEEYNGSIMTGFNSLSDEDIKAILIYLKEDPGPLPAKEDEVVVN